MLARGFHTRVLPERLGTEKIFQKFAVGGDYVQAHLDTDVDFLVEQAIDQLPEDLALVRAQAWPWLLEFPLSHLPAQAWLRGQRQVPQFYWRSRDGQREYAGIGEGIRIATSDSSIESQQQAETELRALFAGHLQAHLLTSFVGAQFNPREQPCEEWLEFPALLAVIPEVTLVLEDGRCSAVVCIECRPTDTRESLVRRACRTLEKSLVRSEQTQALTAQLLALQTHPNQNDWIAACNNVLDWIELDELNKLVFARRIKLELSQEVQPVDLCAAVQHALGEGFTFSFAPRKGVSFSCQSPECLFAFDGTQITSDALGGTTLASETSAYEVPTTKVPKTEAAVSSERSGAELRPRSEESANEKLVREHEFVVRDLEEKLAQLSSAPVQRLEAEVVHLPYISHLRSRITAVAAAGVDALKILRSIHPTPAVGSFPSFIGTERVSEIEQFSRGWYSGPVGVLRASHAEFAVALRGVVLRDRSALLYGGAGIVEGSSPALEWQEIDSKLAPIISLFPLAPRMGLVEDSSLRSTTSSELQGE